VGLAALARCSPVILRAVGSTLADVIPGGGLPRRRMGSLLDGTVEHANPDQCQVEFR